MLGLLQCLAWRLDASKGMFKLQMMQQASETGAGFDLQGREQAIAVDRGSGVEQRVLGVAPSTQPDFFFGHGQLQGQGGEIPLQLLVQLQSIALG